VERSAHFSVQFIGTNESRNFLFNFL